MSSILSDQDIRKAIGQELLIEPFDPKMIRPSSIRLCLGSTFLVMVDDAQPIDTQRTNTRDYFREINTEGKPFVLPPKTLVLAPSLEKIGLSPSLTGLLNTISSLARIGLSTHGSSGLVPAGYGEKQGAHITFELYSFGTVPIILYPAMPVCHLTFVRNFTPAEHGYEAEGRFYRGQSVEPADFSRHPVK